MVLLNRNSSKQDTKEIVGTLDKIEVEYKFTGKPMLYRQAIVSTHILIIGYNLHSVRGEYHHNLQLIQSK